MAVETTNAQVMDKINLSQLLPEWGAIFNGSPQTGTELSAWFVVSLLALTIFFLGFSFLKVHQARQRIKWLDNMSTNTNFNSSSHYLSNKLASVFLNEKYTSILIMLAVATTFTNGGLSVIPFYMLLTGACFAISF